MTITTYAIGDIHGRLDLLDRLIGHIEVDAAARSSRAKIVFTGDFVDRGPDSCGVIERLIAGPQRAGDRFVVLRGNHDDLFIKAVADADEVPEWARTLFWHTILSYGLDQDRYVPHHQTFRRHVDFLNTLRLTHDDGTHLFVHAGIRPGVALADQTHEDLTWIREPFLSHQGLLERRVVHGHTIMGDTPVLRPHRVSIDTGAYKSGILTAAVIDGDNEVSFLQAMGRPDRGALVREAMLVAAIEGRVVSAREQTAFDDFVAERIDVAAFQAVMQRSAAA